MVDKAALRQPQIPVTLPTYDEVIGRNGISNSNYNDYLISLLRPEKLNVLAVHAEVEGIANSALFERFLTMAKAQGVSFIPLGGFLNDQPRIDCAIITAKEIAGRDGWASFQETDEAGFN